MSEVGKYINSLMVIILRVMEIIGSLQGEIFCEILNPGIMIYQEGFNKNKFVWIILINRNKFYTSIELHFNLLISVLNFKFYSKKF